MIKTIGMRVSRTFALKKPYENLRLEAWCEADVTEKESLDEIRIKLRAELVKAILEMWEDGHQS